MSWSRTFRNANGLRDLCQAGPLLAIFIASCGPVDPPLVQRGITIGVDIEKAADWPRQNVLTKMVHHQGRPAIKMWSVAGDDVVDKLVIIPGMLRDGIVEVDAKGVPESGQSPDARAYFGIAFRTSTDFACFESMYVRPENSRADDQLRRNRSTQYIAFPDRPWQTLRGEFPGKYESYVDLEPGTWTKLRVQIAGRTAKLYVSDAAQPALIVTDLVSDCATGNRIGLWIGNRTIAYFANVKVAVP